MIIMVIQYNPQTTLAISVINSDNQHQFTYDCCITENNALIKYVCVVATFGPALLYTCL